MVAGRHHQRHIINMGSNQKHPNSHLTKRIPWQHQSFLLLYSAAVSGFPSDAVPGTETNRRIQTNDKLSKRLSITPGRAPPINKPARVDTSPPFSMEASHVCFSRIYYTPNPFLYRFEIWIFYESKDLLIRKTFKFWSVELPILPFKYWFSGCSVLQHPTFSVFYM